MDHVLIGQVAVPEGSPEALAFAGDGESVVSEGAAGEQPAAATEDAGGDGLSGDPIETEGAGGDERSTTEGTELSADERADAEDLTQYPERLRERFKSLSRDERRELYEFAEQRVEPKLREKQETEREETERLRREAAEAETERATIRDKFGRHFGESDGDIEIKDRKTGEVIATKPSYAEVTRLLSARNGDDILDEKYGMSRDEAFEWQEDLEDRREMIPGLARHFDDQAWAKTSYVLSQSLKAVEGIDPDALVNSSAHVGEVVQKLESTLRQRYEKKLADQERSYEDRIRTLSLNGEALKGQAAAGSSRKLETDGRTGGGGDGEMTLDQYRRLTPEQHRKLPSAVIDRMTQKMTGGR